MRLNIEAMVLNSPEVQAILHPFSPPAPPPPSQPQSEEDLRAMMRDPRYWQRREPAFVARVTEGFRKLVNG